MTTNTINDSNINPYYGVFDSIKKILTNNMVIKYGYKAEEYETMETKAYADRYMDAMNEKDRFLAYSDYTETELIQAGITDTEIIKKVVNYQDPSVVPTSFRQKLLELRRQRTIDEYDEPNDYYRMLNGLPPKGTNSVYFHYVDASTAVRYNIDRSIPIHLIQDHYNKILSGRGDYFINILEGLGIISQLIKDYPDEEYLKYLGSQRISIYNARRAKNFDIIRIHQGTIRSAIYDPFLTLYLGARDYFVSVVYQPFFRSYIEYYDNFIAMNIMVMTIQQLLARQLQYSIDREYYTVYGLQMLYQAYGVPYDMTIDAETQSSIAQSLNQLIQNKATDKVIYDISRILGYNTLKIYKYYLVKDRKYDIYGTPIVKNKEVFNIDTGETETVPDYDAMYDLYFQKIEFDQEGVLPHINDNTKREEYNQVVSGDPYWWEDSKVDHEIWTNQYNYLESKYIGVGVSYSLTDIMYESVILLKLLMDKNSELGSIKFTIPKILDASSEITLFDATILLCCLTAKKHHVNGEIISIPTQVLHVLDYYRNEDTSYNGTVDSLAFDFSCFTEDVEEICAKWNEKHGSSFSLDDFIELIDNGVEGGYQDATGGYYVILNQSAVYFDINNHQDSSKTIRLSELQSMIRDHTVRKVPNKLSMDIDTTSMVTRLIDLLGKEDSVEFIKYLKILYIDANLDNATKITTINTLYSNIKGLSDFIQYKMTVTQDRALYETLKEFYNAAFYASENKELFTIINGQDIAYEDATGGYYLRAATRALYYDASGNLVDDNIPFDVLQSEIINGNVTAVKKTRTRVAKNYFEFLYWYNPKLYSAIFDVHLDEQYEEYITKNELYGYTLSDFTNDVYLGLIDIDYSGLVESNSVADVSEDLIYYYIDHIISRMENIIDGLNFIYLINDSSSPIEGLLLKLINFFKSYTVDFTGLDVMFICDLKAENIVRFFDEVSEIEKTIQTNETLNVFSYSHDFVKYDATIHLDEMSIRQTIKNEGIHDAVVAIWQE